MKTILLCLCITISVTVKAQFISKADIPVYSCMFVSGLAYGQAEKITWHNPYSRSTYWNPYASDHIYPMNFNGYHMCRLVQDAAILGAICFSVNDFKGKNKGWRIVKKAALCSVSFYVGQTVTYNLIK